MNNPKSIIRIFYTIWCILGVHSAYTQNTERFYNFSRRDGLASGSITSIVQDNKGLIWIGTKQGINRYDGAEFIHFHTGNSGLTSNDISSLHVDNSNRLWIGTFGKGLHFLDLTSNKIQSFENQTIGSRVLSIESSTDSTLLVLSNKGIVRISTNNFDTDEVATEITGQATALGYNDSSLWVGTSEGDIFRFHKDGSYLSYSLSGYSSDITIQKIHVLDTSKILIGTRLHGLLLFDLVDHSFVRINIEALDIRDIIEDKNGTIWIGTDGEGLYRMDGVDLVNLTHQSTLVNSLASNAVHVCYEDRDGNLWFGTAWDGISFIDQRFENLQFYYSDFEGVEQSGILNIFTEEDNLLFGTDGSGISAQNASKLPSNLTRTVPGNAYVQFIDKINSDYWIGTFQSGFFIANETGVDQYTTANSGLSHDDVRAVLAIDASTYLIATWGGGLNVFNKETNEFRKLSTATGQPKDVVTLYRMSENTILVGSFGQGLFSLNLADFNTKSMLEHLHNVVSIDMNDNGVWIGTWGEGLHLSDNSLNASRLISNKALLNNANIVSIQSTANEEEIWLATSESIFRISEDEEVIEMPFPPQQYHLNACTRDATGRLYFGGTDGVVSFRPEDGLSTLSRKVEFMEVKIQNKSLDELDASVFNADQLILNHDQNLITFRFATPVYPSSREEGYEVQLKPINPDWIAIGKERSMTFADLNPGTYEFKVRNSSSKIEEIFSFKILRPWWKTWWAYVIASCVFFGLLFSFRRYSVNLERVKSQLEIEKIGREKDVEISDIKQRFFVNVSHEIRTPLTLIIGEIEQLASKVSASKTIASSLNNLRNNGNHLIHLVNELLDFRKLDQGGIKLKVAEGNFVAFCREIYLSFLNKAEHQKMDYQFHFDEPEIRAWYDRDQLEKVFYNLLSNAFKNTPEDGKIEFRISQNKNQLQAAIKDSGPGIPEKELEDIFKRFYQKENDPDASRKGFGIGLSIVQEIVSLHKGVVSVDSQEGTGSEFKVSLLLGKDQFDESELIKGFVSSESLAGYIELDERTNENAIDLDQEILIVEDNAEIRNFLKRTLSHRFKIQEASNGLEAFEIIQKELPDFIISDVMMPEMDGITLTKKVKGNPTTSHIPIILLTARTGTVFKREGFETGADDYITKPFNSAVLLARIENILKAREILTAQIRNELAVKPNDLNLATPDERFLKDLVQVAQNHLDNSELNAELVASEMGMSHSVVYKKIKALTGYNLVEFIRDYRLQQAGEMLQKFKFTVAETCYKVGFSDKKYFSQIFKKKFGITPSEYAKKSN